VLPEGADFRRCAGLRAKCARVSATLKTALTNGVIWRWFARGATLQARRACAHVGLTRNCEGHIRMHEQA